MSFFTPVPFVRMCTSFVGMRTWAGGSTIRSDPDEINRTPQLIRDGAWRHQCDRARTGARVGSLSTLCKTSAAPPLIADSSPSRDPTISTSVGATVVRCATAARAPGSSHGASVPSVPASTTRCGLMSETAAAMQMPRNSATSSSARDHAGIAAARALGDERRRRRASRCACPGCRPAGDRLLAGERLEAAAAAAAALLAVERAHGHVADLAREAVRAGEDRAVDDHARRRCRCCRRAGARGGCRAARRSRARRARRGWRRCRRGSGTAGRRAPRAGARRRRS